MTELIVQFLSDNPVSPSLGQQTGGDFVANFQQYVNQYSKVTPVSDARYFLYMFLGSILTLPYSDLMQSLGTRKLLLKIEGEVVHICLHQILGRNNNKLTMRTIDFSKNQHKAFLDGKTVRDIIGQLNLQYENVFGSKFDWQILTIDEILTKPFYSFKMKRIDSQGAKVNFIKIIRDNYLHYAGMDLGIRRPASRSFLEIQEDSQNAKALLKHFDDYIFKRFGSLSHTVSEIFSKLYDLYRKLQVVRTAANPLINYKRAYNAFIAGAVVLNLKSKYALQCVIESLNNEIMFKFMPKANLNKQLNLNIPIFVESGGDSAVVSGGRSVSAETEGDRFDLSDFANFFTDSKFGMKILPNFIHPGLPMTKFDRIKINQGMVHKFFKNFDYFVSEMPQDDLQTLSYKEVQYALTMLTPVEKHCLKQYLLGQLMAADPEEFRTTDSPLITKYRYVYVGEMVGKLVTTYALSKGKNKWLLMHIYSPESEDPRNAPNFIGRKFKLPHVNQADMVQIDVYLQEYGFDVKVRKEHYYRFRKTDHVPPGGFVNIGTVNTDSLVPFERVVSDQEPFKVIAENLNDHKDIINDNAEFKNFMKGLLVKHSVVYSKLSKFDSVIGILKCIRSKPLTENPPRTTLEIIETLIDHKFPNEADVLRDNKLILVKLKFIESSDNIDFTLRTIMSQLTSEYMTHNMLSKEKVPDFVTLVIHKNHLNQFQIHLHKTETNELSNRFHDNLFSASTSMHCFASSSRKKRNIKSECLISWEDIEAIGGTAKSEHELSTMKIDSNKLMAFIRTKSKEKVKQMKQILLEIGMSSERITGSKKYKALEVLTKEKTMNTLHKLGNAANLFTHGLIVTHIISDLMHGNYKSLKIYSALMFGSIISMKTASFLERMATKLRFTNSITSKILFKASPFVRRFTAAYNVYDLVQNIKELSAKNNDAMFGIVNDATFLTVDTIEIGLVLAEGAGIVEAGTAAAFFPVGAILAAAVFVGSDVYLTQREISKVDHFIHLSTLDKLYQGFRVFFGFGFSEYVEEMIEEKLLHNHLIEYGTEYLERLPHITAYFYPGFYKLGDQYKEILNDKVILLKLQKNDQERVQFEYDIPDDFKLMCFPAEIFANNNINSLISQNALLKIMYGDKLPNSLNGTDLDKSDEQNSYFCDNTIGIARTDKVHNESVFLIDLKNGDDFAIGEQSSQNVFILSNGYKNVTGGRKNDYFIVTGDDTLGMVHGADGINILDLSMSYPTHRKLEINFNSQLYQQVAISGRNFNATDIQILVERVNKSDSIQCSCEMQSLISQTYDADGDLIYVPDYHCYYKLLFKVSGNAEIQNDARHGEFTYLITTDIRKLDIDIKNNDNRNVVHKFAFDYPFTSLGKVELKVHNDQNVTSKTLKFTSGSSIVTIDNVPPNSTYQFNDNTILKVDDHFHAFVYTNLRIPDILKVYPLIADWLKIFLIISSNEKTTVLIGHDNKHLLTNDSHYSANIMHNDPFHETYFVGNGQSENVYILTCAKDEPETFHDCKVPRVTIHEHHRTGLNVKKFTNTLVLSALETKIRKFLNGTLDVYTYVDDSDLVITLSVLHCNGSYCNSFSLGYIILKYSLLTNSYQKLYIVNKGSNYIDYDEEYNMATLQPVPLEFGNDTTDVIITAEDMEKYAEVHIAKNLGNFSFLKVNESIILTNVLTNQDDHESEPATSIILKDYMAHSTLSTLKMKFLDKTFSLGEFHEKIRQAENLNEKLGDYGLEPNEFI